MYIRKSFQFSNKKSMFNIFILLVIVASKSLGNYQIVFDKQYSPPRKIPVANDMYYSVPLKQEISKPIIAYFVGSAGRRITDGPLSHTVVQIVTMCVATAANKTIKDEWKDSGGTLCQTAVMSEDYPKRMDRSKAITRCGTSPDKTALSVHALKGKIIIDGIFHWHSSVPPKNRIIRIICSSPKLTADTYPFSITKPAYYLKLDKLPPINLIANHPFHLTAIITDRNGTRVGSGLDSIAYVNLVIPYYYNTYFNIDDKRTKFTYSAIGLSVNDIEGIHIKDKMIRKRASHGLVHFTNIRILYNISQLRLNFTMTMARFPWSQIPKYPDNVKNVTYIQNKTKLSFPNLSAGFYKTNKPTLLTRPINIMPQTAISFKVADHTLQDWNKWTDPKINAIRIARNIPIPGRFTVYVEDRYDKRIHSGHEANFNLSYSTIPPGVCVCRDATPKIEGGWADLFVSICQLITKVRLVVSIVNKRGLKVETPDFRVEGKLDIVHLGNFNSNSDKLQIESGINTFISSAISEANEGIIMKQLAKSGFKFNLISVNADKKIHKSLADMYNFTECESNAVTPIQGIISSTNDYITLAMNSRLTAMQTPYISIVSSVNSFSHKSQYLYVNRVCWSDVFIIESVTTLLKRRNWMAIIVLRESNIPISANFRRQMKANNINIDKDIAFSEPTPQNKDGDLYFPLQMNEIAESKVRVLFLFANSRMQAYILRDAYLKHLDTEHGYQWVIIGPYVWEFPFQNEGVYTCGSRECIDKFRGTLFLGETYNVTADHKTWIRVLDRNFARDKQGQRKGIVEYQSLVISARQALGYDAFLMLAYSINRVVSEGRSIIGSLMNKHIRNVQLTGLTGYIALNSYGDRLGYIGFLAQICPFSHAFFFLRLLVRDNTIITEIPFENRVNNLTPTEQVVLPKSTQYNIREYPSNTGMISKDTFRLIANPTEPWPSVAKIRTERVIPAFSCDHKCGLQNINHSDTNIYDNGRCTITGKCQCKPGYAGMNCIISMCPTCKHGGCISPDVCLCYLGWKGRNCDIPYCESCVEGICEGPEICRCFTYVMGKHCTIHVTSIMFPLIVGIIIFILVCLCIRIVLAHRRQTSALTNTDWVIDTCAIEWGQHEISWLSRTSLPKRSVTLLTSRIMETYRWKNEKWYVKRIPSLSVDINDVTVRIEMAELMNVKHANLVKYGGACLTAPNVCLFLEVAHRGSLHNVLHVVSLNLGTEFRYSFMKDICSGMRYLHEETKIGSHGRLTSHNCLIFRYWTIKISGFGVHSLRCGKYRLPKEDTSEDLKNLLWTAPELLRNINCLDEVKNGSKSGDVYSFAIIISEILTREDPFKYELKYISERDLLDLIIDPFNRENDNTRSKWKDIGGVNMLAIRPILRRESLAQTILHIKMIQCILAEAWDNVPSSRPSFKKLCLMLEECYPASGCLIDNLINLISSYSTNLEMIVLERTKEINESKEKSEQLLRQLLPNNIAEELKRGRKVVPELFECVTVFFSDIVNMAEIVVESTPFQIVDFLHDIHYAFQRVIVKYNVYKVDVICDTYIIVSGLPERIGQQHAGEIATMALHLLSLITGFKIRHRQKETLQMRIGIHSGPVVSGIVGTMMPKYCVFGDTVNTASRMQSSCIAHRIQVSDATAAILKELGGYELVSRGMREVKGRGLMRTYWLNGKSIFRNVLPDKSLAIPLSMHHFK